MFFNFILQWVTRTKVWKVASSDKVETACSILDYVKACLQKLPDKLPEDKSNDKVEKHACDAVSAVVEMLRRLEQAAESALFLAMVAGHLKGKDCSKVLPAHFLALSNILEVNWKQELLIVESAESDLQIFFSSLGKFDSACSMWSHECQELVKENDSLAPVSESCEGFKTTFIKAFDKAILSLNEIMMSQLERFTNKYGKIGVCVEAWDMKPVEWVYKQETEKDVKNDIDEFRQSHADFQATNDVLKKLIDRMTTTQHPDLKEVLAKCQALSSQGEQMCKHGGHYVTCIVFSDWVFMDGHPNSLKKIDHFVKKNFGSNMGLGHLPEKLDQQIKAANQKFQAQGSKASEVETKAKVKVEKKAKESKEKRGTDAVKSKKTKKEK